MALRIAVREKIKLIFSIKDTPHRLSIAFAVGVFVGMSPLLGLHTILGIFVAWVFKLKKVPTLIGVYVTNPWTIIPIYTFSTWVGARCLGINNILPEIDWRHLTLTMLSNELSPLIKPFVLGTVIIGALSSLTGYIIIYHFAKKING